MADTAQTKHWFVFRLGHLGDVVLATGVLERLGRDFGLEFTVICKQPYAEIFERHPFVRGCIGPGQNELGSTSAFFHFSRQLAATHAGDGLLDLHGTLRSRMLAGCWRGPVRRSPKMGCARRLFLASGKRLYREALLASNVPQRYYAAFASPPPPAAELVPRLWLSEKELHAASARLDGLFGAGARPVALHPYATHMLKAWPPAHWYKLVELLDRAGIPWISLGIGEPLFPGSPRELSNSGSLRESAALLARCRMLVTGDSGPMHLAAAAGTPVAALFGPTTREWGFYPAGPQDRVLERDLPCRPCSLHGNRTCPDNCRCLAGIEPQQVFDVVRNIPNTPGAPAASRAGGQTPEGPAS